jgi:hypothetical protein
MAGTQGFSPQAPAAEMALTGRALAWLNLAYHFNKHILVRLPKRAFRGGDDAERFRDAVEPEGYVPLSPSERELMPRAMRCINCGLCAIAGSSGKPVSAWDEAWTFVAGPSRSIDRAHIVAAGLPSAALAQAAAVCPMRIPIEEIATMLRRLGDEAAAAITDIEPQ